MLSKGANAASYSVRLAVLAAAVAAVVSLFPASAATPLIDDVQNNPNNPVIRGRNTGFGSGVEGYVGANGGFGVLGFAQPTSKSSIGVYASTTGPSSFGLYGISTSKDNAHPGFGVEGISNNGNGVYALTNRADMAASYAINTLSSIGVGLQAVGSGNAVVAQSSLLNGVLGQTMFQSGLGGLGQAGVLGQDMSTDLGTGNSGIAGIAFNGFGVSGMTTGSGPGVAGFSTSGIGVFGSSANDIAVMGSSASSIGVEGSSTSDIGVIAQTLATPDPSGVNGPPALEVATNGGSPAIKVAGSTGDVMSLDANGNLILSGNLIVDGNLMVGGTTGGCPACPPPLQRPRRTAAPAGAAYMSAQATSPIEAVGEGELVNGRAYVRLDPSFAAAVDPRSNYLVFITPQGESRGLYVTQKSRSGFAVHENTFGHSTLAFDYRIDAQPAASIAVRPRVGSSLKGQSLSPLHTSTATLRFARFPFKHRILSPHYRAGFVPQRLTPPRPVPILHR